MCDQIPSLLTSKWNGWNSVSEHLSSETDTITITLAIHTQHKSGMCMYEPPARIAIGK